MKNHGLGVRPGLPAVFHSMLAEWLANGRIGCALFSSLFIPFWTDSLDRRTGIPGHPSVYGLALFFGWGLGTVTMLWFLFYFLLIIPACFGAS